MATHILFHESILDINQQDWQQLNISHDPFLDYRFYLALEESGSVGGHSGWLPYYLGVYEEQILIAVVPLFIKSHSYGEYIFDWQWANAYQHYGLDYYPKLVSAIPFTPVPGSKIITAIDDKTLLFPMIEQAIIQQAQQLGCSSWHHLFCAQDEFTQFSQLKRHSVQFHWFNQGYLNFADFVSTFKSRKRKTLLKERAAVQAQKVTIHWFEGKEITEEYLQVFYLCYQNTYSQRGQKGYIHPKFFNLMVQQMPEHCSLVMAQQHGQWIAAAWFFKNQKNLYGRYWGCLQEINFLHFELCLYQGIEYAIAQKIDYFNPGTQGEHKISRGFTPTLCYSQHWVQHPEFYRAIQAFCLEEKNQRQDYLQQCQHHLPFSVSDKK